MDEFRAVYRQGSFVSDGPGVDIQRTTMKGPVVECSNNYEIEMSDFAKTNDLKEIIIATIHVYRAFDESPPVVNTMYVNTWS